MVHKDGSQGGMCLGRLAATEAGLAPSQAPIIGSWPAPLTQACEARLDAPQLMGNGTTTSANQHA